MQLKRTPLTPEQQRLVDQHWGYALTVARQFATKGELRTGDWTSAVGMALCEAAQTYDDSLGVPFRYFMQDRIRGALADDRRRRRPKGHRRHAGAYPSTVSIHNDRPHYRERFDFEDRDRLPVGWELESEESVERLARTLPRGRSDVIRRLYLRAETRRQTDLARALGVHDTRIAQLHSESLRWLREAAAG